MCSLLGCRALMGGSCSSLLWCSSLRRSIDNHISAIHYCINPFQVLLNLRMLGGNTVSVIHSFVVTFLKKLVIRLMGIILYHQSIALLTQMVVQTFVELNVFEISIANAETKFIA